MQADSEAEMQGARAKDLLNQCKPNYPRRYMFLTLCSHPPS